MGITEVSRVCDTDGGVVVVVLPPVIAEFGGGVVEVEVGVEVGRRG